MRLLALTVLLPFAAAAAEKAPPPPAPDAPADVLTPAQISAQEMLVIYQEFCLQRFPNADAVLEGVAAHHLGPASQAQTQAALLGRAGKAWVINTPQGHYLIGLASPPHAGCAISGPAVADEGIRAAFELAVESYTQGHEFGMLLRPPLQTGKVAGRDAVIQVIGARPAGRPRQAFVAMQSQNADGTTDLRLTREYAPN